MTAPESVPGWDEAVTVVAQAIRVADGRHTMGAGALAEVAVAGVAPVLLAAHEKAVRAKVAAEILEDGERAGCDCCERAARIVGGAS